MKERWILFMAAVVLASAAGAVADSSDGRKELLFLGGGGEPPGNSTIFDATASQLGSALVRAGWTPTVDFDGGRAGSAAAIQKAFGVKPNAFTPGSVDAEVAQVKQEIADGKLGPRDKVMVMVDTHGMPPSGDSHLVATSTGLTSLDSLKKLRDLLENAGVGLTIVDLSCYSGASQALATSKTCVVSGTSANLVGNDNFSAKLAPQITQGSSVEEAFLAARRTDADDPTLPEISTPVGAAVDSILHPVSDRLVYDPASMNGALLSEQNGCKTYDTSVIDQLLGNVQRAISAGDDSNAHPGLYIIPEKPVELGQAMAKYDADREKSKALFAKMQPLADREERLSFIGEGVKVSSNYTWRDLLTGSLEDFRIGWEQMANDPALSDRDRQMWRVQVQQIEQVAAAKARLAQDPDFQRLKTMESAYQRSLGDLYADTGPVVQAERKTYNALYEGAARTAAANPCGGFTL